MTNAKLYWDAQDPKNTGWWLRYRDARGDEQGCEVSEHKDAAIHELAAAVEAAIGVDATLTGTIEVFHGDMYRGFIAFVNGEAANWRAL